MAVRSALRGRGAVRVAHLIEGDQWAGAEVQVAHLLAGLAGFGELELVAILFAEGRLAQELRRSGISVSVVNEQNLGRLRVAWGLGQELRRRAVDVLHTHGYKESFLGAVMGRWAGVRWYVKTEHGRVEPSRGWKRTKMSFYRWLDHWVARGATDRVIAVSEDLSRHLTASLPEGRVALIRNGLDPRRIVVSAPPAEIRHQLGIGEHAPLFGSAGRLVPVKGLGYFLEATRTLLDDLPEARFLIIGDGPLRSDLERQARELGVAHAVHFCGFRTDIADVMNALDVFVMPSIYEGLPMALLEASVLGKPIVASAVGGIPEVLTSLQGWLVPPGDVPALARACLSALASGREGGCGTPARRANQVAQLAQTMCAETYALYRELAGRNGDAGR
jgi:glycosyltransferase involved in cell wall biosynthesis